MEYSKFLEGFQFDKVEGVVQTFETAALIAAVTGRVDLNDVAAKMLADRGFDRHGNWVGFKKAEAIYLKGRSK